MERTLNKAAVDIGTNSARLLVVSPEGEVERRQMVTGLGRGLSETGLAEESVDRTVAALERYGQLICEWKVTAARAVATSAVRDAPNREAFLDRAEKALGFRPETIGGAEEATLSFSGAVGELSDPENCMVVDIGGGSTELVWRNTEGTIRAVSLQLGSVRMTESVLGDRPPPRSQLQAAFAQAGEALGEVSLPLRSRVVGVAGTWTSLAAIGLGLRTYDRRRVHHSTMTSAQMAILLAELAKLTIAETAAIPSLDPARAPVLLAGAVIAHESLRRLACTEVLISESDLLDGVIASL
ncbi:MAG: Ppx/GppA family phosphatase [Acidimicrobiia bacterium]|nr:Ppx/GppA family phosphatase [Acidimicrobiia bacterium]